MQIFTSEHDSSKNIRPHAEPAFARRYWAGCLVLLLLLALAIHQYFEYRNAELDRRLEKYLKMGVYLEEAVAVASPPEGTSLDSAPAAGAAMPPAL